MRNASGAQAALLLANAKRESTRLWISDHTGELVDWSAWLIDARVSEDVESFAIQGDFQLHRERRGLSSAPKMQDPQPIAGGRRVVFETAITELGTEPGESDWITVFDGRVDDPAWGGSDSVLTLPCRSRIAALLHDRWLETAHIGTYGGGTQQAVMQSLMDAVLGEDAPELVVLGSPDTFIPTYEQRRQSLQDALQALANVNGWVIRERWHDPSNAFRLVLYEPDRVQQTQTFGFSGHDYYMIEDARLQSMGVRTVVEIEWEPDAVVVVEDTAAIAQEGVGRKVLYLDFSGDPFITSQAQAQTLAEIVLLDVSTPLYTQVATHPIFWRAQLGDYYQYLGNQVHTAGVDTLAVTGTTHHWTPDPSRPNTTTFWGRGLPSGGVDRWYAIDRRTRQRDELGVEDEEPPEPPSLNDARLYFTTKDGSAGFSTPSTPAESLGRYVSTTLATPDLFRAVSTGEASAGVTLYRSISLVNESEVIELEGLRAWVSEQGGSGITLSIALDPEGAVPRDEDSPQFGESEDEETAPVPLDTGSITFSAPDDIADGLVLPLIPPLHAVTIHEEYHVGASTASQDSEPQVCIYPCYPSSEPV